MIESRLGPDCPFELSLAPGTKLVRIGAGVVAQTAHTAVSLPQMTNGLATIAEMLNGGAVPVSNLCSGSSESNRPTLADFLRVLAANRLLQIRAGDDNTTLAILRPTSSYFSLVPGTLHGRSTYRLSRFAYTRVVEEGMLLESPLAHCTIELGSALCVRLLFELRKSQTAEQIENLFGAKDRTAILHVLQLLNAGGFLTDTNRVRVDDSVLRQWDFHDLLFHAASRVGRHNRRVGATYRFKGELPAPPPAKQYPSTVQVRLPIPNLEWLWRFDVPLTAAIEARRSVRRRGLFPISLTELGHFLFRVGRIRASYDINGMICTSRPYPGGGACHELEIYPVVDRCEGLPRCVYHYDAGANALTPVAPFSAVAEKILDDAAGACAGTCRPEVLLVLAARFQRLSWKYESIAYATILKDVGVLYQTMYLVAVSMGLAPCALGCGDSDAFCRLIGANYLEETSVGEFMLNGRS
jgi:oxazoline/thiazoline dehydrogenase